MLVSALEISRRVKEGGYGVLAPNVFNGDSIRVCIEVAVELDSPLTIDILPDNHKDIVSFGKLICSMANEIRIPIALDLDHGDSFEACVKAIYGGFTGVMADRSTLSFRGDARQVAEFKNICTPLGITVGTELGQIAGGYDYEGKRDEYLTDPVKTKEFVEKSGCDCLVASTGGTHGECTGKGPDIDFERLKEIKNLADVPLVFHNDSFSGFENIAECYRIDTQKVSMGTNAYNCGLDCLFHNGRYQNGENIGARMAGDIMWASYRERVMDYMKIIGPVGKNWIRIKS